MLIAPPSAQQPLAAKFGSSLAQAPLAAKLGSSLADLIGCMISA